MLFLDSAVIDDAVRAARLPFVGGLSLNPTLLHRAVDLREITRTQLRDHLRRLAEALPGTLFVQTVAHHTEGIIRDAADIIETVSEARAVIKIPYSEEGLRATARLQGDGIATCTTSIFTPLQAFVAATSGAAWIAPYCNRITQAGGNGPQTVRAMAELFDAHALDCRMLVASIKSLEEMEQVLATGATHVTVPLDLLERAARHEASEQASQRFRDDLSWAESD